MWKSREVALDARAAMPAISSSGVMPACFGAEHDRRAVRVVGADEVHLVALHALDAHPDVGLDVFHDVAEVERAVGVGQGAW